MNKLREVKKIVFPAIAAAATFVGTTENSEAVTQISQTNTGVVSTAAAATTVNNGQKFVLIDMGADSAPATTLAAMGAKTVQKQDYTVWLIRTTGASAAGAVGVSNACAGTTINIYDASGASAAPTLTTGPVVLPTALSLNVRLALASQDIVVSWYGPFKPANMDIPLAGYKFKYTEMTREDVLKRFLSRLS